ncbi:MAG: replication and repair protein RecF, partial [Bacteroidota bacterium]|nr:replication and repair protein RecF [Bacteroidota bacterium]
GTTLFGPQKDELKITVNGRVARDCASQGQHKSLLISLKFAEFYFLKEIRRETPIFLLDDIFSELDARRSMQTLELISGEKAQTFVTVTDPEFLGSNISPAKLFRIEGGKVLNTTN